MVTDGDILLLGLEGPDLTTATFGISDPLGLEVTDVCFDAFECGPGGG